MSTIAPGTILHGRYRILSVIGTGGVATVYRATDEQLGRDVALKVIPAAAVGSAELKRVEDEVRLIASLSHPALVTLFDVVIDESGSVLVMQLVDGEDLSARVSRAALPAAEVAAIGSSVAGALAFVHESGVIHRDVKPANILLPSTGPQPALLADFGIARLVDSAGITATGTIIGTASYLSPEQARGGALDGATDVYSLGLVLLEALTGERAFPGTALESVAARLSNDPPIADSVTPEWRDLLERMLHRDPTARPTAAEGQSALAGLDGPTHTLVLPVADAATEHLVAAATTERLVAAEQPVVTTTARADAPLRPARARPGRATLVLGALVLALVVAVIVFALSQRTTAPTPPVDTAPSETAATETSGTPTPTAEPIVYPQVDGELGSRLAQLQQAVDVGDEAIARQLGEQVLAVSNAASAGDFELARTELEQLGPIVDDVTLSAEDREAINKAREEVKKELEALIKEADKPGKDKPGKP
jgi:eukaryotic-like serine/threonine-protein kinase